MSPLRPSGGVGSSRPGASHLAQTPTGRRTARGPASVAAFALIASLTLSGGAALADGNGTGDSAQSGATAETELSTPSGAVSPTDETTTSESAAAPTVDPITPDDNETANEDRPPKPEGDWYWSHGIFWGTCGGIAPSGPGYPGVNDGGISYPEGYYSRTLVVEAPYIWSDDAGDWVADLDNPITDSDTGYVRVRDLTNQERTELGCSSEPEVTTIPSFTLPAEVSESDARDWTPDVPEGVEVTADSGWRDDATRTITVAPKDGYVFADGQQTEFTVTVTRPDSEEEWQYSNRDPLCAADAPDGVAGWYIYTNKYRFDYEWNTEAQAWVKSLVGTLIESRLIFSGELTGEELARCSDVDDETTLIPLFTFPETHIDRDAGDSIFGDLPAGVLVASDTGFLADNTRTVTFAAAEGYKFSEGQQETWVFTTDPLSATVPTFTLPSEISEADAPTWTPSVPEGVAIASDSGWNSDGTRVITVSPKDGYTFTDGQQSQFTITVKKTVPLPVDPDNPTQPTTPDNSGGDTDQQSGAPTPSSTPTSSPSTEAAKVSATTTDGDTLAKTGTDSTTLAAAAGLLLALGAGLATTRRMRKA